MDKQSFLKLLYNKLLSSGTDENTAKEKCLQISDSFDKIKNEDAAKYYTEANADMIVKKLLSETASKSEDKAAPTIVIPTGSSKSDVKEENTTGESKKPASGDFIVINKRNTAEKTSTVGKKSGINSLTNGEHPRILLWILIALCAPSVLLVLALIFGASLAIVIGMAGMIILLVAAIVAIVCGGSAISVIAFIYGITQIISEPRYVGLHEIGLALVFAGITIAVSIILYNIAVRLIPLLYKLIGKFLRYCIKKLKHWAVSAWKGCENL